MISSALITCENLPQTLREVCMMYGRRLCSGARCLRGKGQRHHQCHQRLGIRQVASAGWWRKLAILESLRSVCTLDLQLLHVPSPAFSATSPTPISSACVSSNFGQTTTANHSQAVLHYPIQQKLCTSLLAVGNCCCALRGALHCCQSAML